MVTVARSRDPVPVLHDDGRLYGESTEDDPEIEESPEALDESRETVSNGDEEDADEGETEEINEVVMAEMRKFEQSFKNISQRYRLINRIGEGTFSTVYKAEDLLYEHYQNDWDMDVEKENRSADQRLLHKPQQQHHRPRYVAIKKIYVTSSPLRILNELELLHDLRDSPNVCPLITAFRCQDQVIAVLPFFQHQDFREYYRELSIPEIRIYFHNLFTAMASVHEAEIIHRDIKPTNFLYSPSQQRGVLVDFGLAEREGTDWHSCNCCLDPSDRSRKVSSSLWASTIAAAAAANQPLPRPTYPKEDQRGSRRANRAGTRGFRAPEVLLKCTAQTCAIDVWSCGVILLTLLTKRFPFFHSADDIDAFIELCTIYGKRRMKDVALLHGQILQTNLGTISDNGHTWEKVMLWCLGRHRKDSSGEPLTAEEQEALDFMKLCLELDPAKRITADRALTHPFLDLTPQSMPS